MKKILLLLFIATLGISAQEHDYSHHLGIFLGGTSGTYAHGHSAFTIGLEYEYMLNHEMPGVGIGFIAESVMFDETELIFGLPVFLHVYKGLKFYMAPSVIYTSDWEDHRKYDGTGEYEMEPFHEQTRFFMRFGTGYSIHAGRFAVTPTIAADIISAKLYVVYGIDFAITF